MGRRRKVTKDELDAPRRRPLTEEENRHFVPLIIEILRQGIPESVAAFAKQSDGQPAISKKTFNFFIDLCFGGPRAYVEVRMRHVNLVQRIQTTSEWVIIWRAEHPYALESRYLDAIEQTCIVATLDRPRLVAIFPPIDQYAFPILLPKHQDKEGAMGD